VGPEAPAAQLLAVPPQRRAAPFPGEGLSADPPPAGGPHACMLAHTLTHCTKPSPDGGPARVPGPAYTKPFTRTHQRAVS
jgi:hypothetical protein